MRLLFLISVVVAATASSIVRVTTPFTTILVARSAVEIELTPPLNATSDDEGPAWLTLSLLTVSEASPLGLPSRNVYDAQSSTNLSWNVGAFPAVRGQIIARFLVCVRSKGLCTSGFSSPPKAFSVVTPSFL